MIGFAATLLLAPHCTSIGLFILLGVLAVIKGDNDAADIIL